MLTGRGGSFCAGGDLDLMADGVGDLKLGLAREQAAALLREMPEPTLAAVNGPAAGAGFSLALAADSVWPRPTPASPPGSGRSLSAATTA